MQVSKVGAGGSHQVPQLQAAGLWGQAPCCLWLSI